jgi:hypothetical protein
MNYFKQPLDYTQELKSKGLNGRRKAMAFKDYLEDVEMGDFNSERFYAEAWRVSKTTARNWVLEFREEIDRFLGYWQLKNHEHYSYIKKQSDQYDQTHMTKETPTNNGVRGHCDNQHDQHDQTHMTKAFNISNNNNRLAEDFFNIYRLNNGKFTGNRQDAIYEYINLDESIEHKQLLFALSAYKQSGEQMVGAAKFLRDKVYLSWMLVRTSVLIDGVWIDGNYDSKKEIFTDDNNKPYRLDVGRMTEKIGKSEIKFLREVA